MAAPTKPAIVMAGSGLVTSYRDYDRYANQVAHLLRGHGMAAGDHMAIFMENTPEMLLAEAGAERVGVYYTLANSYLSAEEVAYIVENSAPPRQPLPR